MKRVDVLLVVVGICFAVAADLDVRSEFLSSEYPRTWVLILPAAVCWTRPAWRSLAVSLFLLFAAAAHVAILLCYAEFGGRTFFGGAMIPVVAGLAWILAGVVLIVTTLRGINLWSSS